MTTHTDRDILRCLAERQAEIAALPIHQQTVAGWKRLNDLKPGKPMVHIYQVCWHEMDVDGELTLQCQDPFHRVAKGPPHDLPVGALPGRYGRHRRVWQPSGRG